LVAKAATLKQQSFNIYDMLLTDINVASSIPVLTTTTATTTMTTTTTTSHLTAFFPGQPG